MICNKCKSEIIIDSERNNDLLCSNCKRESELPISAIDIILEPQYQLGKRYEILSLVGRGGIGIVYKAKDYILDEIVALKVLAPGLSMNQEIVERFKQETKITRRLIHDNIIRIYDIGKFDSRWYISMEYVEGKDLKTIIRERGALSVVETTGVIKQVLSALEVVHENHIINRDIKPQNILIRNDGVVKIGDFSIAKATDLNGLTNPDVMIVGSPEYMAPEQIKGERIDARTDIYSVGIVLYELLTGRLPFESDTLIAIAYKQIFELPLPPKKLNPQIPVWLDNITRKCLAKNPQDRYQQVKELIADLETHRVPRIDFEQEEDKIIISQKTFLKFKKLIICSIISIFIAIGITGYLLHKYNKNQNTLQITRKDAIDNTKKLTMLQTKLQELEKIKQELETQINTTNEKLQKTESEKMKLLAELQTVKPLVQKGSPSGMILIEAGEFIMGSDNILDAQPQRKVYVDSFYIDKYEVTNEEYVEFLNSIGKHEGYIDLDSGYCKIEKINGVYTVKKGYEKYPVVEVSWNGANMYAKWAGKRLPTEAEWEKAARGVDGRKYPWGDTFDRNKCNTNMRSVMSVGSYPEGASPYGCQDMAGNVWEWVADWYSSDYYKNSPLINPQGPHSGTQRVWRGGSWLGNKATTQCDVRNYLSPESTKNTGGFRCAKDYK